MLGFTVLVPLQFPSQKRRYRPRTFWYPYFWLWLPVGSEQLEKGRRENTSQSGLVTNHKGGRNKRKEQWQGSHHEVGACFWLFLQLWTRMRRGSISALDCLQMYKCCHKKFTEMYCNRICHVLTSNCLVCQHIYIVGISIQNPDQFRLIKSNMQRMQAMVQLQILFVLLHIRDTTLIIVYQMTSPWIARYSFTIISQHCVWSWVLKM